MIEILVLIKLCQMIGDVARRRGRDPVPYGLLLVVCWIAGEIGGAMLGVSIAGGDAGTMGTLLLYGFALGGAAIGATVAFLIARSRPVIEGQVPDPPNAPARRSRLMGALVGSVGAGLICAFIVMYAVDTKVAGWQRTALLFMLSATFVGGLLGSVSGLQKEKVRQQA